MLSKLLSGDHNYLITLRSQASRARLESRELTDAGFYCKFDVPADMPRLPQKTNFHLGDVDASIDSLRHGAGFVIFVRDGAITTLEGYSIDEPWPNVVGEFALRYQHEPRRLEFPE